jgi:hypothetical protein
MKKIIPFIFIALFSASAIKADLVSGPRMSFLWNQFNSVTVLDTFALATTDFGVALLRMNPETGLFDTDTTVLLSNQAISIDVADNLAVVRTTAGIASLFDLSLLPQLNLIGEIDIGTTVHDVVLVGTDVYMACGFQGLRHYALVGGNSFEFIDSSLAPVHCVQVESDGPYLTVLDDYNGLLRYQPNPAGIGPVQSIILVPRRVDVFFINGDTAIMSLVGRPLVYRASFDPVAALLDSVPLTITPDCVFASDTLIVAIDLKYYLLETVSTITAKHILASLDSGLGLTGYGDTYRCGDDPCLLLTSQNRGLLAFNLANLWYDSSPRMAYARPGPIKALAFHKSHLATGGVRNPLELFDVDLLNQPISDTTNFNVTPVDAITDGGEVLFSYSSSTGVISAIRFQDGSISTVGSVRIDSRSVRKLVYYDRFETDAVSYLLAISKTSVEVIAVSGNWGMSHRGEADPLDGDVLDAIVIDAYLLVSTDGRQLLSYLIQSNSLLYYYGVSTPAQLDHMVVTGQRGVPGGWWHHSVNLGFSGHEMYEIILLPDAKPGVYLRDTLLPVEVTNSARGYNALYTIGPGSCGFMDLSYETPKMTAFGGYGGSLIAVHDSILATSDGTAIHLYQVPGSSTTTGVAEGDIISVLPEGFLHQNYPNPFNPQTIIAFDLPRTMHVELAVYDVLGRRVVSLLNCELPSGQHSAEWTGIDNAGGRVASGVYFYRLTADGTSETRKMVHLK